MSKPADTYRNQNACVNCLYSVYGEFSDLLCRMWTSRNPVRFERVEEHGICDRWEVDDESETER